MCRWDKQLLTARGLFFSTVIPFQKVITLSQLGLWRREPPLVDSDRSGRTGLYVSLSFSQRLSLLVPLDLLSCKCAMWATLRQILGSVNLPPEICWNFVRPLWIQHPEGSHDSFHMRYVGQHSLFWIDYHYYNLSGFFLLYCKSKIHFHENTDNINSR